MRIWTVTAAALALFVAGTGEEAHAVQAKSQSPAVAGEPSARQLSLSRRYIELMQSDQLSVMIRSAIETAASLDVDAAELATEDREFMLDLATELTTDMMPQMLDRMVPVYARVFSEDELLALIAFYDSDLGRSILEKTYSSMPEANAAMMEVMPQLFEKMAARMCVRYGCDTAEILGEMGIGGDTTARRSK
ncbi:MAG: DUF2059 domain-containing protein [Alphaproteobacteria bacterium]|nr:DUF2059 domain-containing protein [Alphaproteobacteria bacterium]MBU2270295.1 DUF2059 domain-containing protein [Alphaproteobacteria bacterium]MBU2418327.1 DUF2059 domain-containing protein [Alphaproteobacteria bacterium]